MSDDLKAIKNENKRLQKENEKLEKDNERLANRNEKLKRDLDFSHFELEQALSLSLDQITLSQFRLRYLTSPVTVKTMPRSGGIYAYYNHSTDQIYIGQSKNMQARLKQHFKRGSLNVSGHDSQFVDNSEWSYYVLEFIDKDNKKQLDDREAYWIALAKLALSDKDRYDEDATNEAVDSLLNNDMKNAFNKDINNKLQQSGQVTNRTRGNNIKM